MLKQLLSVCLKPRPESLLLGFIILFLCAGYSSSFAQESKNLPSSCDTLDFPPMDGTIHARYFNKESQKEQEMTLLFSEGVLKEMMLDGDKIPENHWKDYDDFVQGICRDYEESNKDLCETEIELQRAEEEMQHAREEMKDGEVHVLIDGAGIALAEARVSLEEVDRMHGDEIRREIARARMEIRRATDEFRRENLPEIHREISRVMEDVQEALRELDESQQNRYNDHARHYQKQIQSPGNNGKEMESTLEELEKK